MDNELSRQLDAILQEALDQAWFARGGQKPTWDKIKKTAKSKIMQLVGTP